MNKWRNVGRRHEILVSPSGECLAEVKGTYPPGTYRYGDRRFIDRESAKRAAEADHGGCDGDGLMQEPPARHLTPGEEAALVTARNASVRFVDEEPPA